MVAVVSGNGLGLFNTSLTQLGGLQGGPASLGGRAGSQVINIAEGNLILQDQDETLSVRGFSTGVLRTYNSRGSVAGIGQDGWMTGFERKIEVAAEKQLHPGMLIRSGDGTTQYFGYVKDGVYQSTEGGGAHDLLTFNATTSTWTYTEGSTRREEDYAALAVGEQMWTPEQGRLLRIRDFKSDGITPAQFDVFFNANSMVSEVRSTDGSGATADAILFGYDVNNRLTSITTREAGATKTQVTYGYDAQDRLSWVQHDLTPTIGTDNTWDSVTAANNNGLRFRTSYSYVTNIASDLRIASVSQSDGQTVSYTYEADGVGGYRIKTVTQGSAVDGSAQTLTFTYNAASTDIADSLGRVWTYQYDTNKQLTAILAPAVNGQRDATNYTYDISGNVTQVKTVRGAVTLSQTDQSFDANGNLVWQWTRVDGANASSVAVRRDYDSSNQLISETRYTGLDADGPLAAQVPTGGLTSNFVYDPRNRLRFSVDATGTVTENTYATAGNGIGQIASTRVYFGATYSGIFDETSLAAWATVTQKASSQLSEFTYDAKGRLQQSVNFASVNSSGVGVASDVANEIISFNYDAQGMLLQKITVRGAARTTTYTPAPPPGSQVISYVYDGLGRLLSVLTRDNVSGGTADAVSLNTTYAYADSGQQVIVTLDSGATRTETRNRAGQITAVAQNGSGQTTRTTQNFFDGAGQLRGTQDASGARRYFFYDAKGRLEAEVDTTGAVTQYVYDGADRRVTTVAYANRVTTSSWLSGSNVTVANFAAIAVVADASNDRTTINTYDLAGRLLTQTDAANGNDRQITTYSYDGAGRVTLIRTTDSLGTAATARETRQLYDANGRVIAKVDAENYVSEYIYDAGGRLVKTVRYATATNTPSAMTLAGLRPVVNANNDQSERYFYDGRGQLIGTLDAQGYLTEAIIDEAGNVRAERRYGKQLTGLNGTETFAALKTAVTVTPPLPTELYRESKSVYNALGQLLTQTNFEGTVTRFSYDETGRLVRTQTADATSEVREGFKRYNVFDELIGEITGEQVSQAISSLGGLLLTDPGLTEAQLNTVYGSYGVTHAYDALSRRIESRDAQGNKTWFFYDSNGRQTFTVRGVAQNNAGVTGLQNSYGEVTETRYSAFGQVTDNLNYTGRIAIASPYDRASVQSAIGVLSFVAANDTRRQFVYDQRGLLKQSIDSLNVSTNYYYTAFGQLNQEMRAVGTPSALSIQYGYDKRGLQIARTEDMGQPGQVRTVSQTYDAFGRVITSTDARGTVTNLTYDRLGRQLTRSLNVTSEGALRTETYTTAYDSYSRKTQITDALGNVTSYVYSDVNRSLVVTSQEGVAITTIHNRHGQTVTVSQLLPDGSTATTTTTYDKNGVITNIQQPGIATATNNTYDVRGMLYESTDASGRKIRYTYDAVGRVLTRSEDPTGLNLLTTTSFDGQGRQVKVTDATGRVSTMSYDQEGRLLQTALDPSGLNVRTNYTYDAAGRQITVTEGFGTAAARTTQYVYDVLGRRTQERTDPAGLNLTVNYLYDANDNVVQRTDATGNVSRFVYDEANRRIYDIDPNGSVSKTTYDKDGRIVAIRNYATAIIISDLSSSTAIDASVIKTRVDAIANEAIDQLSYRVYDRDSRVRFIVTHLSGNTASIAETLYDSAGRVKQNIAYTTSINLNAALKTKLQNGDVTALADINALLQTPITTAWSSGFDGNSLAGFNTPAGLQAPPVVAGRVVFDRNAGVAGAVATGFVTNTRHTLGESLIFKSEFATETNIANTMLVLGLQNEVTWQQNGFRREAIIVDNGVVYKQQITDNQETRTQLFTLSANTTYVVEIETQDGLVTTYVYVKGADRSSGVSFSAASSSVSFGSSYWFATGLYMPGVSGGSIYLDNVSATTRQRAQSQTSQYDSAGRLIKTIDGLGNATSYAYDAAGRAVRVTNALSASDYVVFDAAGRARYKINALGEVVESMYDASGREVTQRSYANRITINASLLNKLNAGIALITDISGLLAADNLRDRESYVVFDNAGRAKYSINNIGTVIESVFDGSGMVVAQRTYANTIAINATLLGKLKNGTSTSGDISPLLAADNARDLQNYVLRDAAGRQRFSIDALGNVTETRYDAAGRATESLVYAAALSSVELNSVRAGAATIATLNSFVSANSAAARASKVVFNAAGQAVYTITRSDTVAQLATVVEQRYDASGNRIAEIQYGINIAYGTTATVSGVTTAIGNANGTLAQNQRITRFVYDVNGRLRFNIDNAGSVTELRYDAVGNAVNQRQYSSQISLANYTEANVATTVAAQTGFRETRYVFDNANRLASAIDAQNKNESYGYDALGQRISMTNKLGFTWRYEYDAAGRLTVERSPSVNVSRFDASGNLLNESVSITTRSVYDGLGNLVSRTENADAANPLERRTTQYLYDSRGNQIKTIFPDAYRIDSATNQLVAIGSSPFIEVTYDTMGRAVVQKDVRGNYTYKVYDVLGRTAYDIDAEGYVSAYSYNAYGEQTGLLRFFNRINATALVGLPISLTQAQAAISANAALDRNITTIYDSRGLKSEVRQASISYYTITGQTGGTSSPTTRFTYNAYGELVKESVQIDSATWADSYSYFDTSGRLSVVVDAEGFVTRKIYNALNELTQVIEYARAIDNRNLSAGNLPVMPLAGDAASGYDRITRFSYDSLGRKISETSARHYQASNGSQMVRDVVTALTYDAEGQLLTTTIDGVLNNTLTYDSLGHTRSLQEAVRDVLRLDAESQLLGSAAKDLSSAALYEQASPYSTMEYDAFGNTVRVVRYANGMRAGTATADASRDQTTITRYDYQGRAVMTLDALGNRTYSSYDAADNVTSQWHAVRGSVSTLDAIITQDFLYDKNGLQTDAFLKRKVGAAAQVTERQQTVGYNAFGEITSKSVAGITGTLVYNYDNVGNLISSNESGALRSFGYTLAGVQVFEQRGSVDEVYRQTTDRLGRIVQMVLPSHTALATLKTSVVRTLDRWGNALLEVDPRGFSTQYEFNELNQKTVQRAPTVEVVAEDGTVRWLRPETHWLYDALGRQIAIRDANGKVDQMIYDSAGRLLRSVDGTGAVTQMAYDALGNAQMSQNPVGYLTYQSFDRLGRVVSMGDYLPDASGNNRNKTVLQQYTLSQDGQRVVVTDAMNQSSKYDFDGEGKLLKSISAMGVQMNYAYDNAGNKISTTDAYATQTWQYDIYGRLIDHKDLSAKDYEYVYSTNNGLLTSYTNQWGANSSTTYYSNGLVKRITEGANWYEYEYDANGNRTLERTNTVDGGLQAVYQESRMSYDSNNRLSRVITKDLNAAGKVILDVRYGYDAVGNRRVAVADSGYGTGVIQPVSTNAAPNVIATLGTQTVKAGIATQLRLSPSDIFLDPERDLLTYSATLSSGAVLPSWLSFDVSQLSSTGELVFTTSAGTVAGQTAIVRLIANDGINTKYLDFTVTVANNAAPVAIGSAPVFNLITNRAFNYELPVSSYFSDINAGDVMSFSVDSISPVASWLTVDTSSPSAIRLSGTPITAGTYTMTVRATDGSGAFTTRTISLVVANNLAPVAQAALPIQNIMIGRDFEISRPLNQLFVDSNGDALTLTASMPDGSPLPAWMNLQVLNDTQPPTVRLVGQVPASMTVQSMAVKITARDLAGLSATQTVNLQLNTDPGVLAVLNPIYPTTMSAVAYGATWSYQVPSNTFAVANTNVPISYSASGMPSWMTFNPVTRVFSGTPAPVGSWPITVTATAGTRTVTSSFTVSTANSAPQTITPIPNQTISAPGQPFNFTVPANTFRDYNNDPLTLSATGLPAGVTMNAAGVFTGTPAIGSYQITVSASDGQGGVPATAMFSLVVGSVNAPPSVNQNYLSNLSVSAVNGDFVSINVAPAFTDPNGDLLTYTQSGKPGWLSFNAQTGVFSGVAPNINNSWTITITANDGRGGSASGTFSVDVSNGNIIQRKIASANDSQNKALLPPVGTLVQTLKPTPVIAAVPYDYGSTASTLRNYQLSWYTYDGENRTIVNNGKLVNGQIVIENAAGAFEQRYDAAGNAVVQIRQGSTYTSITRSNYNLRGQMSGQFGTQYLGESTPTGLQLSSTYDAAGRLLETRYFFDSRTAYNWVDMEGTLWGNVEVGGWLQRLDTYTYDLDGRLLTQTTRERDQTIVQTRPVYGSGVTYDVPQWLANLIMNEPIFTPAQIVTQTTDLSVLTYNKSSVNYTGGYDAAGRLSSYTFSQGASGSYPAFTWTYIYTYQGREGWLETGVSGTGTGNYKATTSTGTYDAYGRRMDVTERTRIDSNSSHDILNKRYFSYDHDGGILQRRDGYLKNGTTWMQAEESGSTHLQNPTPQWISASTWDNVYTKVQREALVASSKNQRFSYANGQLLGSVTQAGSNLDARSQLTAYSNSSNGDGTVVVQDGDTLEIIAQRIYGNRALWYVLGSANAIEVDSQLVAGTTLNAPDVKVHQNDANTFKPYNAGEIIGPTAPSLPYIQPPKNNNCAMIVMVVVAVVVSVVTAGALSGVALGALGTVGSSVAATMAAGAIAGAASAAASMAVGSAMGVASFSWRGVAAGAITGALTAGIADKFGSVGEALKAGGTGYLKAAALAVGNQLAGYAGNKIAGVQGTTFSWKAIASGAVGSMASAAVGNAFLDSKAGPVGKFGQQFLGNITGGLVTAHARKAFGLDEKVNYGSIARDAFGNTLGNAIGGAINTSIANRNIRKLNSFITARIESLDPADRDNPIAIALSEDIPIEVKRQLWQKIQNGESNFSIDTIRDHRIISQFNSIDGKISVNEVLLEMASSDGDFSKFASAQLISGIYEEMGHMYDLQARSMAGLSISSDSSFDEGAIFATLMMRDSIAQSSDGGIHLAVNISGQEVDLSTNTAFAKLVQFNTVMSGRIFADRKSMDGAIEYYGPEGHYLTTYMQATEVADAIKGNAVVKYQREQLGYADYSKFDSQKFAEELALWAQMPDMMKSLDAHSLFMEPNLNSSLGPDVGSAVFGGWKPDELKYMRSIYSGLHNLAPDGMSNKEAHEWLLNQRSIARQNITTGLGMALPSLLRGRVGGDGMAIAGMSIHKLGDSYSHVSYKNGLEIPYDGEMGHGLDSARQKLDTENVDRFFEQNTDPDIITQRPLQDKRYVNDLTETIMYGLGIHRTQTGVEIASRATARFDAIYSLALRATKNAGGDASAGQRLYAQKIMEAYDGRLTHANEGFFDAGKTLVGINPVESYKQIDWLSKSYLTPAGRYLEAPYPTNGAARLNNALNLLLHKRR